MNHLSRILAAGTALLLLSACSMPEWMGGAESDEPLPGIRKAVLESRSDIAADPTLTDTKVVIPDAVGNDHWFFDGEFNQTHLAANTPLKFAQTIDAVSEASEHYRLSALPVIAGNTIYLLGGEGEVKAYDVQNLKEPKWTYTIPRTDVPQQLVGVPLGSSADPFQGGGLTFAVGGLFVTTGDGRVIALDGNLGTVLWQREIGSPVRSNPVAFGEQLYFITIDNEAYALNVKDGQTVWNIPAVRELTGVLGHPSPAISETAMVAPFSSGDIYGIQPLTGKPLWTDTLSATSARSSSLFTLNDIDATPVIAGQTVYTVSHEGVLVAMELATGKRLWQQRISSLSTPWVAGEYLYIITTNSEVLCLKRTDGRVKWVVTLDTYKDEKDKKDRIIWNGPVLAGENLFIVGSQGKMLSLSPYDGSLLQSYEIPDHTYLPPVVAGGVLYLLSNDGKLSIFN
ncbi:MAG: hypothetical protein EB060_01815 [Proteobacteria bacterium]|nr:hypothetical protein [Pseudomonadota bacterium]